MTGFDEYSDLTNTGFYGGGEQTPPEEEFFHSVYIAGTTRKNHINIEEISGKYQIRGVEYNLEEVNIVIVQVKEVLANIKREKDKDKVLCFSYKDGGPPWNGTSKMIDGTPRECPTTSAERAVSDFCNTCRNQIIVAGIYCKPDGSPILTDDNKPTFVFIRGKGMRYSNVSNYLRELYKEEDLKPIFEPVTSQSTAFEKNIVNNKRFVTNFSIGSATSSYGNNVSIFELKRGTALAKEEVLNILNISQQILPKFNEKFDWTKNKHVSGYGDKPQTIPGVLAVDDKKSEEVEEVKEEKRTDEKAKEAGVKTNQSFSFDGISF